jgi:hypothetical protein
MPDRLGQPRMVAIHGRSIPYSASAAVSVLAVGRLAAGEVACPCA